jgi:hypothetical protein
MKHHSIENGKHYDPATLGQKRYYIFVSYHCKAQDFTSAANPFK